MKGIGFKFLKKVILMYMDGPESIIRFHDFEEKKGLVMHNGNNKFFSFQNQTLVPSSWQHMCMAVTDDGITTLVLNGEIIYKALLKGAIKKIHENKPIIIMEIWGNSKRKLENMSTTQEEVINSIFDLGYKLAKKLNDNYIFFPKSFKV